ncbi:hypothetical protein ILUMI_21846 [Ignelater luminosus]|uniref:Uncharacterized protein n=1 Tax=Ignelater luminosus TaxID=2038154 RepID=A0A8K0CFH8_IGNLU|nr:hypothetical protein ILUMI_21846 [Ignelater luminosus]
MISYMCVLYFLIIGFVIGENVSKNETEQTSKTARTGRDSYLDAYAESHGANTDLNKVNTDREMNFPTGFNGGFPDEHFGVQYPYPSPSHHHNYGPPQHMYGPPAYKPTKPVYEPPPHPVYNYGPPPPHSYGIPYAFLEGLLDKFKLKWDLITLFKILLKLVIFKKIETID